MKSLENKYLFCLAGPTAVGKTSAALKIAKYFKCEIFSADSRQLYKEMNIGTAKISFEEMEGIKHHFIGSISIHDSYNTGLYEKEMLSALRTYFEKNNIAILTGGTGLYFKSILDGLDKFPDIDAETVQTIQEMYKKMGLKGLQNELKKLDPSYFEAVDQNNPHRLIRALSVCYQTGEPYSNFLSKVKKDRFFIPVCAFLNMPRENLYKRINDRVDIMISTGLLEEAKELHQYKDLQSLQTVGYKELFSYFEGEIDLNKAIESIKQHSRQYAKRQLTWFRNDQRWTELNADNPDSILKYFEKEMKIND